MRNRNAHFANFAARQLVVAVVPGLGRQVESNRQAGLTFGEVAAIQLSWVTYFGAGLAALKRRHIGFDSVLLALPMPTRMLGVMIAEIVVIGFFLLLTWTGLQVLEVLAGERLVSLTWVPVRLTQSIIPIGGFLFILGELLSLPAYWRATAAGISLEHAEIEEEVETELRKAGEAGRQ